MGSFAPLSDGVNHGARRYHALSKTYIQQHSYAKLKTKRRRVFQLHARTSSSVTYLVYDAELSQSGWTLIMALSAPRYVAGRV
jgi:hypothetical protein